MKTKLLLPAVAMLCLFLASCFPAIVSAQTVSTPGFAAEISPLPILLQAKPGTTVTTDLRVNNPSTHDEELKVELKTFTQDGPDGTVTIHDPTPADSYLNWVSFSQNQFDAPPGLWQTIHMTIKVPSTAAFGYYFAVEFTQANPTQTPTGTSGTAIQGAVASFVLLDAQVPGEARQLQVTSFSADHQIYEFLPVNFSIRLHNNGNIYGSAAGNIFISRGGHQVAVLTVNASHGLVIPNSNRLFSASWSNGFPVYETVYGSNGLPLKDKNGNVERKLNWNFSQISKLRFGHYTANLVLVYNNGQQDIPITGSLSFWVIPWRLVGAAIVILIFMVIGFLASFKRISRSTKRLSTKFRKVKGDKV